MYYVYLVGYNGRYRDDTMIYANGMGKPRHFIARDEAQRKVDELNTKYIERKIAAIKLENIGIIERRLDYECLTAAGRRDGSLLENDTFDLVSEDVEIEIGETDGTYYVREL